MVLLASYMQITMVNGKKEADVHVHHLYIADYNYRLEGSSKSAKAGEWSGVLED